MLIFLSDEETPHASTSNLDDEEHGIKSPLNVLSPEVHDPGVFNIELTEDSEILSRPTRSASFTPSSSKKKKRPENSTDILISRACAQLVKKENQFDTIAKTIASKLRSLPHEQRIYAEKIINDVLFEAELGCLNRNYKLVQEPAAKIPIVWKPLVKNNIIICSLPMNCMLCNPYFLYNNNTNNKVMKI